jgi:hypothetical protein
MKHTLRVALFVSMGLLAMGCSQTHVVKGKVITGNLSFVAVVDQGDARLKSEGLTEALVAMRADVGTVGGFQFGEAKTDQRGDFTVKFKEQNVFLKPVEFSATKDGYQPARGVMNIPPAERRLLIIVAPNKAASGAK